jgi:hypothetical protein
LKERCNLGQLGVDEKVILEWDLVQKFGRNVCGLDSSGSGRRRCLDYLKNYYRNDSDNDVWFVDFVQ